MVAAEANEAGIITLALNIDAHEADMVILARNIDDGKKWWMGARVFDGGVVLITT